MKATNTTRLVGDIMSKEPVCADGSMTLRQLARLLEENEISGAPVVGPDGRVVGVVSKSDLIRRATDSTGESTYYFESLEDGADDEDAPAAEGGTPVLVEDIMTSEPITATATERVVDVARRMADARVHRIIIVDRERFPIGVVTSLDILRVFPE
ncbi:MAG: CBS domain-containing protein [Phycisphaerales bacterium]|nr:CBS domain-containing protein [Phycisphaerales bacterium]